MFRACVFTCVEADGLRRSSQRPDLSCLCHTPGHSRQLRVMGLFPCNPYPKAVGKNPKALGKDRKAVEKDAVSLAAAASGEQQHGEVMAVPEIQGRSRGCWLSLQWDVERYQSLVPGGVVPVWKLIFGEKSSQTTERAVQRAWWAGRERRHWQVSGAGGRRLGTAWRKELQWKMREEKHESSMRGGGMKTTAELETSAVKTWEQRVMPRSWEHIVGTATEIRRVRDTVIRTKWFDLSWVIYSPNFPLEILNRLKWFQMLSLFRTIQQNVCCFEKKGGVRDWEKKERKNKKPGWSGLPHLNFIAKLGWVKKKKKKSLFLFSEWEFHLQSCSDVDVYPSSDAVFMCILTWDDKKQVFVLVEPCWRNFSAPGHLNMEATSLQNSGTSLWRLFSLQL